MQDTYAPGKFSCQTMLDVPMVDWVLLESGKSKKGYVGRLVCRGTLPLGRKSL